MNIKTGKLILGITLASTFFITGCTTGQAVKSESPEIIEKSINIPDATFVNEDEGWKDINTWIDSIPKMDIEPELSQALNRKDLTLLQTEILNNRLAKISGSEKHVMRWAQSRMKNEDYAGAIDLLRKKQFQHTKNPQVLYLLGRSLTALKRYDEAKQALLRAIHYNESRSDYYNALANVGFSMGDSGMAEAALKKSIKIDENQPYAFYNLAISKYNNEMYDDSLRYFTKSALLYKKTKQYEKVSKVIGDIADMKEVINKNKIRQVLKTINQGE